MLQEYVVFLSLILSGFSQSLIQNACDTTFGVQSVEYICNGTGITLQWIVEPVVVADTSNQNSVRFANTLSGGDSIRVENIVATLDSVNPFVSRLRIEAVSTLNQANVTCTTQSGSVSLPYTRNNYVPRIPVSGFINGYTRKEDCVTLNLTSSTSTDVDFYAITNSQNNEMVLVEASQSSGTIEVTIPVTQDSVVFNVTTQYLCGYRISNSETYSVDPFMLPTTARRGISDFGIGFLSCLLIAVGIVLIAAGILICVIAKWRKTIKEKNKELLDVKEKNNELLDTIEEKERKIRGLEEEENMNKELLNSKEIKIRGLEEEKKKNKELLAAKDRKIKELKEKGRKNFNMGGVEP